MDNLHATDTGRGTNRYLHTCSAFTTSEIRTTSDLRTTDKPFAPERLLAIQNHLRERTAMPKVSVKHDTGPSYRP